MIDRSELIKMVAPCSLMCYTCSGYCNGAIAKLSHKLIKQLDGIEDFYRKNIPDKVEGYKKLEHELTHYACAKCNGCRSSEHNGCSIKGCFILECTKSHGVDFCGECESFPCDKVKSLFDCTVYNQWLDGNEQIQSYGIELYYENNHRKSHYSAYKK